MLFEEYLRMVARKILSANSSEEEALTLMIIFHTQRLHLPSNVMIEDGGDERITYPLTRRHASEIIASFFPADEIHKSDSSYWHLKYDQQTPFEGLDRIPIHWMHKVEQMMIQLKKSQIVSDISEDE
jgi:hypothetical protein